MSITPEKQSDWLTSRPVDDFTMPIEGFFRDRLPELYDRLNVQLARSLPMEMFDEEKLGPASILKDCRFKKHMTGIEGDLDDAMGYTRRLSDKPKLIDFAGVYVFLASEPANIPFYVGITRKLLSRVQGHVRGGTHNKATLLYQFVCSLEGKPRYRKHLSLCSDGAKAAICWFREQRVAILPLASPVERYALELYASIKLRTGRWNSFETH